MKIRLKTIIILSYIFIILIFFLGITFIVNSYILDALTEKHIQYAETSVEELTEKNKALAKQALRAVSRDFVNLYVADAAKILAPIIKEIKYDKPIQLRQNKKLHKLISQPIRYRNVNIGYTALTSSDGLVLIDPNPKIEGKYLATWKDKFPAMLKLFELALKNGRSGGYYRFWATEGNMVEKKYISIVNIPQTKLYVCSYVDFAVICDPINDEFNRFKSEHTAAIRTNIEDHALVLSRLVQRISLIFIIFLALICILFALWIANKISRPISQLNIAAKKLGEGDFNTAIEARGSLEIFELSNTFNELGRQLVGYMDNLKKEITAREALEAELKIARNIQMSILQNKNLQDPRNELSLFATLYPAKEVAGDFYDFFYLDEGKRETLVVLMADVSGKGIYAAIFMAMAKTIIKNLCQAYPESPVDAMQRANNLYLNSESMFVTMFLGYYNIVTGEMLYANGGHHSAIHIDKDQTYKEFGVFNDPLLGLFADNIYHVGTEQFAVGDTLFLYTDGLTEAINDKQEAFGEERLKRELLNNDKLLLEQSCANIFNVVSEFEQGNRFDDITMLMLRREG